MNRFILIIIIISNFIISQNMWNGNSVATSDNVDALFLNPAGLGIKRTISSVFIPENNKRNGFSIQTVDRYGNIGYRTEYSKGDPLFNPTDFSIGFGSSIAKNLYAGFSWNKYHKISLGLLFRPLNIFSSGLTINTDEKINLLYSGRIGFAVRPFLGDHRITFGTDIEYTDQSLFNKKEDIIFDEESNSEKPNWNQTVIPFIELPLIPGLTITAKTFGYKGEKNKYVFDNWSINIGISFGKFGIFSDHNQFKKEYPESGFGFYTTKSLLPNIITFVNDITNKTKDNKTWVKLKMEGLFIEEPIRKSPFNFNFNFNPFSSLLGNNYNGPVVQLRKWVEQLNKLTLDKSIHGLIIDWKYIVAGFGKRQEIYDALKKFKDSGKKIIIYSKDGFTNNDYYIVSLANEIYMHEDGGIDLRGFNIETTFYKGLLDTLDIIPEFIAISPYKSAIDAFTRKNMSPEVKENVGNMFHSIYSQFIKGISDGREWDIEKTTSIIDKGPFFGKDILYNELITGYKYPDEFDSYVEKLTDENLSILEWDGYNKDIKYQYAWAPKDKPKIAVIYAVGAIMSGESSGSKTGSTTMGDETIRDAIKTAREDKNIDAIVLRIDSPGGSGSASDLIWREIIKTTDEDTTNVKPFIASMSDVAASGGYYIACQADTIVAYPTTVTGSIGVLGGRLNLSGFMNKIGITYDRIEYGKNSSFWSGGKLWTEEEQERFRKLIIDFYGKFVTKVVSGREHLGLDSLQVDSIALGRVWSGLDAKDNRLVDEIGGLFRSIDIAKKAAKIPDETEIEIVEYPIHKPFRLFKTFETNAELNMPYAMEEYKDLLHIIELLDSDEIFYLMPYIFNIN